MNTDSQAIAIVKRAGHACGGHADFRYFFPIAPRDKYPCKRRDDGSTRRHGIFPSDRDYCRTAFPFDFRQRRWLPSPTTRYKTPIPYLKIYYLNITHIIPTEKLSKLIQACSDRPVPASHSSFKPEKKGESCSCTLTVCLTAEIHTRGTYLAKQGAINPFIPTAVERQIVTMLRLPGRKRGARTKG